MNHLKSWLPSRGNVLFTLVIAASLIFYVHSVGAFPSINELQVPNVASTGTIAYQGRLFSASGVPLNSSYPMTFTLYSTLTGIPYVWREARPSVTVNDGLFNVLLGSVTPISPSLISGNNSLWLGVQVGADPEMSPRIQLGSAPYAFQSLTLPNGTIDGYKLANTGFGASDSSLQNFIPINPRIQVLTLANASTMDWTFLDLSNYLPDGSVAVLLYARAQDANSGTSAYSEIRFDKPNNQQGVFVMAPPAPDNRPAFQQGIVPLSLNRGIEYKVTSSYTGTFNAEILIVGYFERANKP